MRRWTLALLGSALLLGATVSCGASTPETPPDEGTPPVEGTTEAGPDAGSATEPGPDAGGSSEVAMEEPPPVPEMLAGCDRREEVSGTHTEVHFNCGQQIVSYYESDTHIEHSAVIEPLLQAPGFRVEVESREIVLGGTPQVGSILYHTDENSNELVFALSVVTEDLSNGGTRVISCFMMPEPDQVSWCDAAVTAIASIGVRS